MTSGKKQSTQCSATSMGLWTSSGSMVARGEGSNSRIGNSRFILDDYQDRGAIYERAVALEHIRHHDRVGDPGLVLQGQKQEAFGGARALADDYDPCDLHARAVARRDEFSRAQHATRFE